MSEFYLNPISPALPPIPADCPRCGESQRPGTEDEITDVVIDGKQTICHTKCLTPEEAADLEFLERMFDEGCYFSHEENWNA